jgi:hypothetical protein
MFSDFFMYNNLCLEGLVDQEIPSFVPMFAPWAHLLGPGGQTIGYYVQASQTPAL